MVARTCTYRVQLHAGFTFAEAAAIAPYLATLGVSHLYCSPYLQAQQGSTHGYDVVDHSRVNDELGGAVGHARLIQALTDNGLGQVLDIVPNHMARGGRANRWWWDVLENGPLSRYASYFDIDWDGGEDKGGASVLIPVLGDQYGRVLEAGELHVSREGGAFVVRYHGHVLPISPRSLDDLLSAAAQRAGGGELADLADGFGALPHAGRTDPAAVMDRHQRKCELVEALAQACAERPEVAAALDAELAALDADPDALDVLLGRQNYRLAHWRTASEELDYRRFFDIATLVALRIEDEDCFAAIHEIPLELVRAGVLDGLRIDHVDGLRDPLGYLKRLRRATRGVHTVVEKIIEPGENLPAGWPVEGTSGYDFLTRINNLFVDPAAEVAMTACYEDFTGRTETYGEVVHGAKQQIMRDELATELERLTRLLAEVCAGHRRHRDHTRRDLRAALREVVATFGVYRTYAHPDRPVAAADRVHVRAAVEGARQRRADLDAELLEFLGDLLLLEHPGQAETEFALRFAQLSAPVMAKGVEDTAFYRYHRLISLNEVGGNPEVFGSEVADFHLACADSARRWPASMATLSTHDTKRAADVRARIHLLAEIPDAWRAAVTRWAARNERHRMDQHRSGRGAWPDRELEYLLYQTLVGAWPIGPDRVVAFLEKASREAKIHTSWTDPIPAYEDAVAGFARAVLADAGFSADLTGFLAEHRLVERGRVVSLAQTTLLLTCPGVPDMYQGDELWDLSLVDPDNRRPVDYARRERLLATLTEASAAAALRHSEDGGVKLWLIHRLLAHRRLHPHLYTSAEYRALPVIGAKHLHVVAFARSDLAVIVPRLPIGLGDDWAGTGVTLPPGRWRDVLGGALFEAGTAALAEVLAAFPVAVLARERT